LPSAEPPAISIDLMSLPFARSSSSTGDSPASVTVIPENDGSPTVASGLPTTKDTGTEAPSCQLSISNQPRCWLSVEPPLTPSISRKALPPPTGPLVAAPPGLALGIVAGTIAPLVRSKPNVPPPGVPPASLTLVVRPMRS